VRIPVWLVALGATLGCGGPAGQPSQPVAAEPADASAAIVQPEPATETPTAEIQPATADEVAAICRAYRRALRSHWDDQRTRQEVRGLELQSDEAVAWQVELASGDSGRALAATRAVVASSERHELESACEPLASLVQVAETMMDVPDARGR